MRCISLWLGLGVSSLTLYLAWRGLEWHQVTQALARAHWIDIALAFAAILLALVLMAWRWQLVVGKPEVTYGTAWTSLFVALMANNLLPGRIGEVIRPLLMARLTGLAQGYLLAKALIDRVFDLGILGAWSLWVLIFPPMTSSWARQVMVSGVIICALILIGALVLRAHFPQRRLIGLEIRWLPPALREKISKLQIDFHLGLQNMRVHWWALAALTALIWGLVGASLDLTLRAFSLSLDIWSLVLLGVLLNLGSFVPALPGQVGTYQLIGVWLLGGFGIEKESALSFALTHHVLWYVPSTLIGMVTLGYTAVPLKQLLYSEESNSTNAGSS